MLLDFHNCTYSTEFTEHSPPDDVERAAVAAAQLLQKKLQVRSRTAAAGRGGAALLGGRIAHILAAGLSNDVVVPPFFC
jgi:hypothetical protein